MNGLVHSRLHMYIYINYKVLYVHVHVHVYMYVRTKSLTKKSYTCVIYGENDIHVHNICVDTEQYTTKGLHYFPLSSLGSGVCYAHMYMYIVYMGCDQGQNWVFQNRVHTLDLWTHFL